MTTSFDFSFNPSRKKTATNDPAGTSSLTCNAVLQSMRQSVISTIVRTSTEEPSGEEPNVLRAIDRWFLSCGKDFQPFHLVRTDAIAPSDAIMVVSISYPATRLSVNLDEPAWLFDARRKLAELLDLPDNWDSYGGRRIRPSATSRASSLLESVASSHTPKPSIGPTCLGGVQFEWHTGVADLEVEVGPDGRTVEVFYHRPPDTLVWDDPMPSEDTLTKWIEELSKR